MKRGAYALDANPDLPLCLGRRLELALPGRAAQAPFQSQLGFGRHFAPPPPGARAAAVVILLYQRAGVWHIPLTLRPPNLANHAGQVSLPGGLIELGEESAAAALRELREELGVTCEGVKILGGLSSLYLFATNFLVAPWLAYTVDEPRFVPCPDEVEELIELPIRALLTRAAITSTTVRRDGLEFTAACYQWGSHAIWGATSMILAELAALLSDCEGVPN